MELRALRMRGPSLYVAGRQRRVRELTRPGQGEDWVFLPRARGAAAGL